MYKYEYIFRNTCVYKYQSMSLKRMCEANLMKDREQKNSERSGESTNMERCCIINLLINSCRCVDKYHLYLLCSL